MSKARQHSPVGRRLEESEERFALLVDGVKDYAIFMLDAEGYVASWNKGAERIKGYQADEIIGEHLSRFLPPERAAAGGAAEELRIASHEGRYEERGWRVRKDGSRFWAHVVITALRDASGALRGFAKVTRDITEQRVREEQLREAVRLRDEFIEVAAHELRTPLTALRLQVESAQSSLTRAEDCNDEAPIERARERLARSQRSLERLVRLTENLVVVSRLAAGKLELELEQVDLVALTRTALERARLDAERTNSTLSLRSEVEALCGCWDPTRIEQVVESLLSNAIKYGAHGPIDIRLACEGELAVLQVSDRGIGVAASDRERIFNRFERAVSARHYGGLGLGLYMARQIAEAHGGTIAADGRSGAGTVITLRLPRRPPTASDCDPGAP